MEKEREKKEEGKTVSTGSLVLSGRMVGELKASCVLSLASWSTLLPHVDLLS